MHAVLRATAWAAVALGFFALGADVYWSWKAQGFAYRPIGFYLDLIDTRWAFDLRVAATRVSDRAAGALAQMLTWPVWAPAFAIGIVLAVLATPFGRRRA